MKMDGELENEFCCRVAFSLNFGSTYVSDFIFNRASTKAECDLSSLSGVFLCRIGGPPNPPTPPGNGISTGNFLISSPDLGSPTQFNLE